MYGADDVVGLQIKKILQQGAAPEFELTYAANGARLFAALGVVRPLNGEPTLLGGVIYHNLHSANGKPVCIEASIAFDRPGWAGRDALRRLFAYPFIQLGCATLVARVRRSNKKSRRLVKGLGFDLVGPIPHAFDGTEDIMLYAMTKAKCRWLKERSHGKIHT
jgi:RimJ/RimL family protein N-acetyltransferase